MSKKSLYLFSMIHSALVWYAFGILAFVIICVTWLTALKITVWSKTNDNYR